MTLLIKYRSCHKNKNEKVNCKQDHRKKSKTVTENGSAGLSATSIVSPGVDHLVFDAEVVENAGVGGHQGLSVGDVDPDRNPGSGVLLLELHYRVLEMGSRRW